MKHQLYLLVISLIRSSFDRVALTSGDSGELVRQEKPVNMSRRSEEGPQNKTIQNCGAHAITCLRGAEDWSTTSHSNGEDQFNVELRENIYFPPSTLLIPRLFSTHNHNLWVYPRVWKYRILCQPPRTTKSERRYRRSTECSHNCPPTASWWSPRRTRRLTRQAILSKTSRTSTTPRL